MTWSQERFGELLKHPLFITFIAFIFTGILANSYQNHLSETTKGRDLEIARRQRAADAVKTVTDIIYERVFRGNMVVSSLKRHAPLDELRERKKAYDDVFIRYNSEIQSNLFRIREMFRTTDYTDFDALMEGTLHDLFSAQDSWITNSYDDAIAPDEDKHELVDEVLLHCKMQVHPGHEVEELTISELYNGLINCEYSFTDVLFRTVEQSTVDRAQAINLTAGVESACRIQNETARQKDK